MQILTRGFGLLAINGNQQINGPNSCSLATRCISRANIITCQQSLINTSQKYYLTSAPTGLFFFPSDSGPEDRREPLCSINIMGLSETFTVKIILHLHVLEKR